MPAPDADGLGPEIKDNTDGSICVQYHPNKSGRHEVQMCYEGCAVEGSPFSCMVDKIDGSYVTAFGAGLVGGMSGQMVSFTVTAKQGSLSKLDVKVDGPTKTDITRKDHGDKCDISFLPMTPGIYNIIVKYNGKEMKGSPFVSKVSVHDNGMPSEIKMQLNRRRNEFYHFIHRRKMENLHIFSTSAKPFSALHSGCCFTNTLIDQSSMQ